MPHFVATAHEQALRGGRRLRLVPTRKGYIRAAESAELIVAGSREWRAWLRAHHSDSDGVWLVLAKRGTTHPTMLSYDEALEEAICFGWIDGQLGRRDAATFRRRFTPRKARSPWSQRNVTIVEQLTAAGRMQPSGDDEVRKAKGDGRWEAAYAGQAAIEVLEDLTKALGDNPQARAFLSSSPGPTATSSCTGSPAQSGRTPAPGASSNSLPCWPAARPFTPRVDSQLSDPTRATRPCRQRPQGVPAPDYFLVDVDTQYFVHSCVNDFEIAFASRRYPEIFGWKLSTQMAQLIGPTLKICLAG